MADSLKVRISNHSPHGHDTRVYVNDLNRLTLDLYVHEIETDGLSTVQLSDANHDLLTRLGWTPPADNEGDTPCSD